MALAGAARIADRPRCSRRARPTMYWSRNDGDTFSTLATLSKPSAFVVLRQQRAGVDSSRAGPRLAFAYSVRFRRCSATRARIRVRLRRPGRACFRASARLRVDRLLVGLRLARRRHQAAAQLAHRLFPDLGVVAEALRRHRVEGDAAGPVRGVVALAAVLVEELPLGWAASMRIRGRLATRGGWAGRCRRSGSGSRRRTAEGAALAAESCARAETHAAPSTTPKAPSARGRNRGRIPELSCIDTPLLE